MFQFEILKPCSIVFDVQKTPLEVNMSSGVQYHYRDCSGKVCVNFPLKGIYYSNYKPFKYSNIHEFYNPSFKSINVPIMECEFSTPVAAIDISKPIIKICKGFKNINFQHQVCIIEHEKAHCIAKEDEQKADRIAANNYLKLGFNQSQFLDCLQKYAPNAYNRHLEYFKSLKKQN